MLSGLKFVKKGEEEEKTKSKKDKKKEKRKEQKKRKQEAKKDKNAKKEEASNSSSEESEKVEKNKKAPEKAVPQGKEESALAAAEADFFSSLGAEQKKEVKLKPDPEKTKVSEREYNPFLRGEESNLAAPEESGVIPKHLRVGDGGSGWRRRMQKRQAEDAGETPVKDLPPARGRDRDDSKQNVPGAPGGRGGPSGGGWRAAKKAAGVGSRRGRSRSRSRSCSRSRSASRRRQRHRSRSRSRSRHRSRSRSSPPKRDNEKQKEVVARAVLERVKASEDGVEDDADEIIRRLQSKYSNAGAESAGSTSSKVAEEVEEDIDPNKLGAMAMEAMLSGDMARYEELNKRLEKKQASVAGAGASGSFTLPPADDTGTVKVLEEVDAAGRSKALLDTVQTNSVHTKGRNKRGNANAVPGGKDKKGSQGYYEDDEVSLDELVRRERIAGVQDYDANFEKHILKKGNKFKMLDEDEDEAYALGWYENKDKKLDERPDKRGRTGADKRLRDEKNDKNRIQVNLERCTLCMESKKFFRKDAIMSVSPHAYVCVDAMNRCVLPGQILIVPQEHASATTDLDEAVWADIRNYQKCIVRFFESEQPPRAVIFTESSVHRVSRDKALLGAGPHCCIVCYPIEMDLMKQARTYWKKAFDEAESEFETTHKKVIETDAKGGVRRAVPKGFPYVHADFGLGGGFAHVVDDVSEFPRDFAQHVMAGMCELTILDRAYSCKSEYSDACKDLKERFAKDFDWTQALRS